MDNPGIVKGCNSLHTEQLVTPAGGANWGPCFLRRPTSRSMCRHKAGRDCFPDHHAAGLTHQERTRAQVHAVSLPSSKDCPEGSLHGAPKAPCATFAAGWSAGASTLHLSAFLIHIMSGHKSQASCCCAKQEYCHSNLRAVQVLSDQEGLKRVQGGVQELTSISWQQPRSRRASSFFRCSHIPPDGRHHSCALSSIEGLCPGAARGHQRLRNMSKASTAVQSLL